MKQNLLIPTQSPNFLHRLPRPNLIIHSHHRHKKCIFSHRRLQFLHINHSRRLLDGKVRYIIPLLFQRATRVQYAFMLRLSGDNVFLPLPLYHLTNRTVEMGRALDTQIV